jgi:putative ABC transport system substrate-binding protein
MRESCTSGSVRGARGNSRPYRDRRREFIAALGGAAVWPLAARAQQPKVPVVVHLSFGRVLEEFEVAFRKGLSEVGFVEGRNIAIEDRWAENQPDRIPAMVSDVVRRGVTVIYASGGNVLVSAIKAAITTIPIIFLTGGDPVEGGLVESFNRPGGNVTGISFMNVTLTGKRLGLLHDLVPSAIRFAYLANPNSSSAAQIADAKHVADTMGRQMEVFTVSTSNEIDSTFERIVRWRAEALLIGTGPLFAGRAGQLATLAARHALLAIHYLREYTQVGGLMSYGSSIAAMHRQAGIYVGRILKGEKPADLPVMQPTKFELVINLQTARTISIEVPPTLLAIADEVIE